MIKILSIKRFFIYLSVVTVLDSCRQIYNIIPTPNDDPGWPHRISTFNRGQEILQMDVDKLIENNGAVVRVYNIGGYDKGIYRQYRTLCNSDTLEFNINFNGDDSISSIVVRYFRLRNIAFRTSDYKEQKRTIKNNKDTYDMCQACYEKIFLTPLREYFKSEKQ